MKIKKQTPKEPPCMAVEMYPYVVSFSKEDEKRLRNKANEIVAWGQQNIGRFVKEWGFSSQSPMKAYFFSEGAAMMFILQWQGEQS